MAGSVEVGAECGKLLVQVGGLGDLLCVRQMELLETLVPGKSSALGELDVDTGYVGGHTGLGGWHFLS